MRIYISGPITGIEMDVAYRKFSNAEWKIDRLGHIPVNPFKIGFVLPRDFQHHEYIDVDMAILKHTDAILLLEGWENSKGCTQEFSYACRNDMPIYYSLDEIPTNK